MNKIVKILTVFTLIAALFAGCTLPDVTHEHADLTITLPGNFADQTDTELGEGFEFLYVSSDIGLCGLKETKSELEQLVGELDAKSYAELLIELNELDCTVSVREGVPGFKYSDTIDGEAYTYLAVTYEVNGNLWLLQAYCKTDKFVELETQMYTYLTSVSFTQAD